MITGSQSDIFTRLNNLLPSKWFVAGASPIKDAIMQGAASVLSQIYSLYAYAKGQSRIATSVGAWLDIASSDFFGTNLPRNIGEADSSFLSRIQSSLFVPRTSRPAMITVLTKLTGRVPVIWEPMNPNDMGAMGAPTSKGYCNVARMGSMAVPYNTLIIAYRAVATGQIQAGAAFATAPKLSAMGTPASQGYTGSLASQLAIPGDAAIYAAINATRPAGTVVGVFISN